MYKHKEQKCYVAFENTFIRESEIKSLGLIFILIIKGTILFLKTCKQMETKMKEKENQVWKVFISHISNKFLSELVLKLIFLGAEIV